MRLLLKIKSIIFKILALIFSLIERRQLIFFRALISKLSFIIFSILILINTIFVHESITQKHGRKQTNQELLAASIVISQSNHGATGYTGYISIRDAILKHRGSISDKWEKASTIPDVSSPRLHFTFTDLGLASYFKWAFRIFGYSQESLESLYFLILAISVLVYIGAFWKDKLALFVLLLFAVSHRLVVMATDVVGIELQLYNYRFYAVLAILPSIHIGLLMLKKCKFSKWAFLLAFAQATILIFIMHSRGSVLYQVMFLITLAGFLALMGLVQRIKNGLVFDGSGLWALLPVLGLFIVLKAHLMLTINPHYKTSIQTHHFWCASFTGLSINPRMQSDYGISFFDDQHCHDAVARRAEKDGLSFIFDELDHDLFFHSTDFPFEENGQVRALSGVYEDYVKQEFMSYLEKDPWLVINAYLLKIPEFFLTYFSSVRESGTLFNKGFSALNYFGAGKLFFDPLIFFVVVLGVLVFLKEGSGRIGTYFFLTSFQFVFSLIPPLILIPFSFTLADPGLIFTLVLLIIFSVVLSSLISRYFPASEKYLDFETKKEKF
jgi:hypothetical protein